MSTRFVYRALATAALAAGGVACDQPPLLARSKVISPRVLAIIAEPPEVRPGGVVALRVITGGLTGPPAFDWGVCATPEATTTFVAESSFGVAMPEEGCWGDAAVGQVDLGTGATATLPVPANLLDQVQALEAVYGTNLSAAALQFVAQTAGLPVTVALTMTDGATSIQAIKRVVVADHTDTNTNPPAPEFRFGVGMDGGVGGVHVGPVAGMQDVCAPDDGSTLVVAPGATVEIAPDPTEAAWLQTYASLDATGDVVQLQESAFYSYFATDGGFSEDKTQLPDRDTTWEAPALPTTVTQWLVVRDGRGGTSACSYVVQVR